MSAPLSTDDVLIEKLLAHLKAEGYSLRIQRWYPARVRQLLGYCNRNGLSIETVRSGHVKRFLRRQYRLSRKRYSQLPPFQKWRRRFTGAVNMMLRLVQGAWPVPDPPRTALEVLHRDIVQDSELPLLREPGEAVLRYVEKARPSSPHREVFLRIQDRTVHSRTGRSSTASRALVCERPESLHKEGKGPMPFATRAP